MIEVNKGRIEFKGTNLELLSDTMSVVDGLIDISPEIINAVVAGFNTKLSNSLEKCDPTTLEILVKVVEEYNERTSK